jgi:CubicO group peptidase (beta-lactamase class C family)
VRIVALTAVALALLAIGPRAAEAKTPIEGRWDVTMLRPGMQPSTARATLSLIRMGRWSGWVRFEVLMGGRRLEMTNLKGTATSFECVLDPRGENIRLEGKWKRKGLSGRCRWDGREYRWTAVRAKPPPPAVRFEKGLRFGGAFPKGDAEKLGLGGDTLDDLIRGAAKADTDALVVIKDGKVVCERTFGRKGGRIHLMSVTKFVTAIAIARLLEDRQIPSLDAPLSTWFPEWNEGRKAKVLLRHVLTHTSGIFHYEDARKLNEQDDKVAYVRRNGIVTEPGEVHSYNNDAVALLSGVIRKASGKPADTYLKLILFDPLGIRDWRWDRDRAGNALTYANLAMTARGLALVGRVAAEGGAVKRRTVLKPESVRLLGTPGPQADQGLLWRLRLAPDGKTVKGYYHTGWLGQFLVVYPEAKLVGVRLRRWKNESDAEKPAYQFGRFPALMDALAGI